MKRCEVHGVDAVARDRPDRGRAAPAVRSHSAGELQRLEPKLAGLPPEARARVDEITRLIVEKLLLTPTEQLKAVERRGDDRGVCGRAEPALQPRQDKDRGQTAEEESEGSRDGAAGSARAAARWRSGRRRPWPR